MQQTVPLHPVTGPNRPRDFVPFALGFRPFFLLAGLIAILLMAYWVVVLAGPANIGGYFGPVGWHRHEMLFGYTMAVVSGFLLTAAQNWTGTRTIHGKPLAALAILWLLGRVMIAIPQPFPPWLITTVDMAFIPSLGVALSVPLIRHGVRKNYVFLLLLGLLTMANLLLHLEALALTTGTGRPGTLLAVNLIILLIVIMGGRVIPFFTERAVKNLTVRSWPLIDRVAVYSVVVLLVVEILMPHSWLVSLVVAVACISNAIRLLGWQPWRTFMSPLVWVLHLGYGWVVLGFALKSVSAWHPEFSFLALHALTLGGIGGLTMGMMARVSLGHTGRLLVVPISITVAFVLINFSAGLRVLMPIILPSEYPALIESSGIVWVMAFLLFMFHYTPILIKPRVDGREG